MILMPFFPIEWVPVPVPMGRKKSLYTVQFVGVIFQIIMAMGRKNETICYGIQTAWEYYSLLIDKLCIKNYWKYQR